MPIPAQLGAWIGTVETPNGKLPVRIEISADNQMQIGFAPGSAAATKTDPVKMVPVKELGIEEGFLSGEAATSLSLPETDGQPSKVQLHLLWVGPDRLTGTARIESLGDLPHFGLPLYISLSKQK